MFKRLTALLITLVIFLGFSLIANAYDVGSVTAGVLNVRSGAGTENSVVGKLTSGQSVNIIEYKSNGWLKIEFNGSTAYISGDYVSIRNNRTTSRSSGVRTSVNRYAVTTAGLNFRENPTTEAKVIATIPSGTKILVDTEVGNGWAMFEYNGVIGYSTLEYISYDVSSASHSTGSSSKREQVVEYAKKFIGLPYVYGAGGPNSFDCSGFTKYVYSKFGVSLNRVAADQIANGRYVEKSNLKKGDLILFANTSSGAIGHVGIYIGNNQFIHASTNSYKVRIDNLPGYYNSVYHSARRIFE